MRPKLTSFIVNEHGFVMNGNFTINCPLLANEDGGWLGFMKTLFFKCHRGQTINGQAIQIKSPRLPEHKILINVYVNTLLEIVLSM